MYFAKLKAFQYLVWVVDMKRGGRVYHSVVMAIRCDVISHMRSRTSFALKEAAVTWASPSELKFLEYDLLAAQFTCECAWQTSQVVRLPRLLARNVLACATNLDRVKYRKDF